MKLNAKFSPLVLATSLAVTGLAAPLASQADMSATFAASSMYLWRGVNLSPDGGMISGSLDYTSGGFYAGAWTSSETGGHETDLYLGYSSTLGDFSYNIGYAKYLYPEEADDLGDTDAAEIYAKLGYGAFGLDIYKEVEMAEPSNDDQDGDLYLALYGKFDKLTATYGVWKLEDSDADSYSHITLNYAATDSLSFAVSKASAENDVVGEDPLFAVTWSQAFKL